MVYLNISILFLANTLDLLMVSLVKGISCLPSTLLLVITLLMLIKKLSQMQNQMNTSKKTATSLIKTENIQKMVKEEIRAILDEEGVTPQYLIRGYKQVADIAEKDTDRLRSLDSLSKISGLFATGENKTEELTVWAGFSPEQLESIQDGSQLKDGKAKLLGKAKRKSKEALQEED